MNAQPQCPRCGSPRTALDAKFCQICGARLIHPEAPSDPLVGATLLGRYKVLSPIGEGGMGRVYLGEQRLGEATRRVAIKVLASSRGNDEYIVARFRREAATIASLTHPNTIRIYDYGEEDGRFFSIMEYVSGGSLADLLMRGPIDPTRAERIAWQVAGALDEAHRSGIVHRDLKPENILLARAVGGLEIAKVVDFGIARRPPNQPGEKPLTVTGAVLGTPAFMSPEQFMGEGVDARADVYALALVFFQMVSGTLPWRASSVMDWAERHMREAPATLASIAQCAAIAERYDPAIAHALQKDFKQRTPDALTFMRELTGVSHPPEIPLEPTGGRTPTIAGGPEPTRATTAVPAVSAYGPTAPAGRASPPILGMAIFALGSIVAGYAAVRWVLQRPTTERPTPVVDARVEADASTPGPRPDASTRDPRRARALARLQSLHRLARTPNNLDAVLRGYTELRDGGVLSAVEMEPLAADIAEISGAEIRRLIAARNCRKARDIGQKLSAVGLFSRVQAQFTGNCRWPA